MKGEAAFTGGGLPRKRPIAGDGGCVGASEKTPAKEVTERRVGWKEVRGRG